MRKITDQLDKLDLGKGVDIDFTTIEEITGAHRSEDDWQFSLLGFREKVEEYGRDNFSIFWTVKQESDRQVLRILTDEEAVIKNAGNLESIIRKTAKVDAQISSIDAMQLLPDSLVRLDRLKVSMAPIKASTIRTSRHNHRPSHNHNLAGYRKGLASLTALSKT